MKKIKAIKYSNLLIEPSMPMQPVIKNGIPVIDTAMVRTEDYWLNEDRYGCDANTCFICGKRTGSKTFVHYTTAGYLVPAEMDEIELSYAGYESQGVFPIGRECLKRLPETFVGKFTNG